MKLRIGNAQSKITFTKNETTHELNDILNTLDRQINPLDPNRFMKGSFRRHVWNGRIRLLNLRTGIFPSGFLSDVLKVLNHKKIKYPTLKLDITDTRAQMIRTKVPKQMILGGHKLRDYQLAGIRKAFKYQRVAINSATNSGKSAIAIGITKVALNALDNTDKILLFTQSKDVTKQDKDGFEQDLGMPVGMLGGGLHTVHQVTCATARTLSSALKDPASKVKISSRRDKVIEYMHNKYVPKFINQRNKSFIINGFLQSHRPRFSYDRQCFDDLRDMKKLPEAKITKALEWYNKQYNKLIYKKNKKYYLKYHRMANFLSHVKVVFVDEAQHAPADSFRKVLKYCFNARIRVALTGTVPTKKIQHAKFIGEFGHHIMKISNYDLIKRGISATPVVTPINIDEPQDVSRQATLQLPLGIPKNQKALALYQLVYKIGVVHNSYRNKIIASVANQIYKLKKGVDLISVDRLEQGKLIMQEIHKINPRIKMAYIRGADSSETRDKILHEARTDQLNVLIGSTVIDEGLNIPTLSSLIYAAGGKSSVQILQRIGRLLRRCNRNKKHEYVYLWDIQDRTCDQLYKQSQYRLQLYEKEKFKINCN